MKQIFLNLKRFDILSDFGGVNKDQDVHNWARNIIIIIEQELRNFKESHHVNFTIFLPEAHIIPALSSLNDPDVIAIGSQSVYKDDSEKNGNFGAFTSHRTANSMSQLGVQSTVIGHLEERLDKENLLKEAGVVDLSIIDRIFNQQIISAQKAGLDVLYCVGETSEERESGRWKEVLKQQLQDGLNGVEIDNITIAYEPVWAIGVGKKAPTMEEVEEVVNYIKSIYKEVSVVYGGGLKEDNASDLAGIKNLDGGLIALTRFKGEIGFYPEEFIEIVHKFLSNV